MAALEYCKSWFWADRSTSNAMTESAARLRHEKREEYTVAVGGFERPTAIIGVVRDFIPVSFLDPLLRRCLDMHFEEMEPGKLFLTMATKRTYAEATSEQVARLHTGRADPNHQWGQFLAGIDRVIEGTSLIFKHDGKLVRQYEHFAAPYRYEETESHSSLINHWEAYPSFGKYEHLLREDRNLPW
jgi:hypothetical protein